MLDAPPIIHKASRSIVLRAPDPLAIRQQLPQSRMLPSTEYTVAVKHTAIATKKLRSRGYDVPTPIETYYTWPGKYTPFAHQREMAAFVTMHRRAFNLSEMGTGKSAATLWAADWLMAQGLVKKALIVAPLSTLDRVWANDIFDVLMHRTAVTLHGPRDKRLEALEIEADFYILNHDGVCIDAVNEAIRKNPEIDLIVVDELSMFRNASTKKFKMLRKMLRPNIRFWGLTGTPCPNAPTDAWALAQLINPGRVPKYFGAFRNQTMVKTSQFKWAVRNGAYKIAYAAMQPAIRFKKAECLDLPPVTVQGRASTTTPEQNAAIKAMRAQMRAELADHEITAVNAADKINKIRQILCGAIRDAEAGGYITLDHKPRLDTLLESVEQASAKVIVIVPFKGIIYALRDELAKRYSVEILNGDIPARKRDDTIRRFKEEADPHILLCHPKVMAHGLNLTEADTLIFYAPIYSNDEYQQVVERFNRAGQTRKMSVIRIAAHPIEWQIYGMVDKKALTQDNILVLYKSMAG